MPTTNQPLKPCPFCGGVIHGVRKTEFDQVGNPIKVDRIICFDCEAEVEASTWNNRPTPPCDTCKNADKWEPIRSENETD